MRKKLIIWLRGHNKHVFEPTGGSDGKRKESSFLNINISTSLNNSFVEKKWTIHMRIWSYYLRLSISYNTVRLAPFSENLCGQLAKCQKHEFPQHSTLQARTHVSRGLAGVLAKFMDGLEDLRFLSLLFALADSIKRIKSKGKSWVVCQEAFVHQNLKLVPGMKLKTRRPTSAWVSVMHTWSVSSSDARL